MEYEEKKNGGVSFGDEGGGSDTHCDEANRLQNNDLFVASTTPPPTEVDHSQKCHHSNLQKDTPPLSPFRHKLKDFYLYPPPLQRTKFTSFF